MTAYINKVTLMGYIGQNPEFKSTHDNKEMGTFSVATSETWKDRENGDRKDKTEWHKIVIFNEALVKLVKNYIKKGSRVYLEGALHSRKWKDDTGNEKSVTEIVLQNFNASLLLLDVKGSDVYPITPATSSLEVEPQSQPQHKDKQNT